MTDSKNQLADRQHGGSKQTAAPTASPGRRLRSAMAALIVATMITVSTIATTSSASAGPSPSDRPPKGASAASSRVVGRGDILSTILAGADRAQKKAPTKKRPVARCRDIKFNDAEIEMVVAILAQVERTPTLQLFADAFDSSLLTEAPENVAAQQFDIVGTRCDGVFTAVRALPRAGDLEGIASRLARSMVTRLPEPVVIQSPPSGVTVPVNQPVFIAIPEANWQIVNTFLPAAGTIVEVRAEPVSLRIYSGEPGSEFITCSGGGSRFEALTGRPARVQAAEAGACVLRYRLSSKGRTGDRGAWLGSVTVQWRVQWRENAGQWKELGLVPRTRLFERRVGELATRITRSAVPNRATGR